MNLNLTNSTIIFLFLLVLGILPIRVGAQTPMYLSDSVYLKHFWTLREGALLVRMSDRKSMREKLEKFDKQDALLQLNRRLKIEYDEIFAAFSKNYSFGNVYFFYFSQTDLLISGKLCEMQFFNKQGEVVNCNEIKGKPYLLGEFGTLNRTKNGPLIGGEKASNPSDTRSTFTAFYIMDSKLIPLQKTHYMFVRMVLKTKAGAIKKLNNRFQRNLRLIKES